MKPDLLQFVFLAMIAVAAAGLGHLFARQVKARRAALVKIQRKQSATPIRRARNWRWF